MGKIVDIYGALALMAKKLCLMRWCGNVESLETFLACTCISLDKNLVVKHVEMVEVTRRTLCCTVMTLFRRNILEIIRYLQFCVGQSEKCEAAVHAVSSIFSKDNS